MLCNMRLHHIALGALDVEGVASFYEQVLGLAEEKRHFDEDGALRSIWLDLGGARLMIERSEAPTVRVDGVGRGPFLVAVRGTDDERTSFESQIEARGEQIEARSEFSSYARDPEGNRIAVSTYPDAG